MPKPIIDNDFFIQLRNIAKDAGDATLMYYKNDATTIVYKADSSPVTEADMASHEVIVDRLSQFTPDIPVISEENTSNHLDVIENNEMFWIVDPIDGTKDFIDQLGSYAIMIGLMDNLEPVAGVVYAPAQDLIFWGASDGESYMQKGGGEPVKLQVNTNTEAKVAVASRSHLDGITEKFLAELGDPETKQYGSALKIMAVAQGEADVYPRLAPTTMEWDTAAPEAILRGAGGQMLGMDGHQMRYGKENLRNTGFVCYNGHLDLPSWQY